MKRVLFSMVLLMAVSFAFAQEKNVKEAKSIAGEVKPDFAKAEQLLHLSLDFKISICNALHKSAIIDGAPQ